MSQEMLALIDAYLDKAIADDEFERLSEWLREDQKHVALFVERSYLHRQMDELLEQSEISTAMHGSGASPFDSNVLDALLEAERNSEDTVVDVSGLMHRRRMEEKVRKAERFASWQKMAGTSGQNDGSQTKHYVIPKPLLYGSIAALVAIAAAIIIPMLQQDAPTVEPIGEGVVVNPAKPEPVATLLAAPYAIWADREGAIKNKSKLLPGAYELASGLAKLRFEDGAQVIIQGPTRIELLASDQAKLHHGRIVGYCPPGSEGFTVLTSNARVTDLGTEFGVLMNEDGTAETHVFNGEVELTALSNGKPQDTHVLAKDAARAIDSSGSRIVAIAAQTSRFLRGEEFNVNVKAAAGSDYHRWLAYSMKLRRDPAVMAYYTFEEGRTFDDRVMNVAVATKDGLHGVLGNADRAKNQSEPRWRVGRFPQKRALDFNRDEKQVVVIPHDQRLDPSSGMITIAAWVRRYDPDHFGVLVGKYTSSNEISYQFGGWGLQGLPGAKNQIQFVVNKVTRDEPTSAPHTLKNFGEWEHLAVTFDGATAKFYHNGKPAGESDHALPMIDSDADMIIGKESPANPIPNAFNGELDELILLSRVMGADEIKEMYEQGVPAQQ